MSCFLVDLGFIILWRLYLLVTYQEAVRVRTDQANFGVSQIAPIFSVENNYPIT